MSPKVTLSDTLSPKLDFGLSGDITETDMKTLFIPARTVTKGLDIKKRWYVVFHYYNPSTGKKKRFRESYGINRIKDVELRLVAINNLAEEINAKLHKGWIPFNNDYHNIIPTYRTVAECIQFLLIDRKARLSPSSYPAAKTVILQFSAFCNYYDLTAKKPEQITKRFCNAYLDHVVYDKKLSARYRNNHLSELRTCFNMLLEREIVQHNPFLGIKKLNARSKRHLPFSNAQLTEIMEYLKETDPYFLLFCVHIMLAIRKTEILKLQIKDYDFKSNVINIPDSKSKNNRPRTVKIHDIFKDYFKAVEWNRYNKNHYVFSASGEPSEAMHTNRDYYTEKFAKVRQHFGFSSQQTLYGLKHTIICFLAEKKMTIGELMQYGGFTSVDALQQYLKQHLNQPIRDISDTLNDLHIR